MILAKRSNRQDFMSLVLKERALSLRERTDSGTRHTTLTVRDRCAWHSSYTLVYELASLKIPQQEHDLNLDCVTAAGLA